MLGGTRHDEIGRAVVVEVGDDEARRPGGEPGRRVDAGDLRRLPRGAAFALREAEYRAVAVSARTSNGESPFTSAAAIADGLGEARGQRPLAKAPAALVQEDTHGSVRLEERGVGHAVAVEVGPGEAAEAAGARERPLRPRRCRRRCCAARRGAAVDRGHDHVEIAVGVDVGGPGAVGGRS